MKININKRKTKEREDRKRTILNAATRVFSTKGFARASVSDIAREAGFSKSALYFYFRRKEDIIREILWDIIPYLETVIEEVVLGKYSVFDKIEKMFNSILDYVERHRALITIIYSEAHCLYTSKEKGFREFLKTYEGLVLDGIRRILKQGMEEGKIKDCDIELLSVMLRGLLASLIFYRVQHGKLSNKKCIDFVKETLRHGLLLTANSD